MGHTHSHSQPAVDWQAHTLDTLSAAGHRKGGARNAVVELLAAQDCALTAQEIDDRLRSSGRTVGRASVYRILELLTELKLVQRIDVGQGIARYERHQPDGDHHHHLVCDNCGTIEPFEDPSLEQAIEQVSERLSFAVDEHDVVLHGACSDCRAS
ncbi:Fur family transcriptional regulator [Conexibacter woesei]|uniref:Ferric uptake regulator, Fur family n=1 Tax=Conexibacter woesei (strain DSM 14684 / CCUG 47730 / CIP 108061 / JCM 11494 / NBRC 100937 / ID131577) TaxID=469383 RepID=D3FA60_CONWI|nr:Fur family transcriptional regulator [Conexibacter woesei]ADB53155.1 ferric uptake regulator, Fur family [Conexibacter woesei DSM 14684]